jgi:hypothetical protein
MTDTRNIIIALLAIAAATLGYYYYQSRQNVVEIRLPTVTIDKK